MTNIKQSILSACHEEMMILSPLHQTIKRRGARYNSKKIHDYIPTLEIRPRQWNHLVYGQHKQTFTIAGENLSAVISAKQQQYHPLFNFVSGFCQLLDCTWPWCRTVINKCMRTNFSLISVPSGIIISKWIIPLRAHVLLSDNIFLGKITQTYTVTLSINVANCNVQH